MGTVRYRVGADIGGTFTDVALLGSDGSIATAKVSSTPEDYGVAIIDGVMRLMQQRALDASHVEGVVHGTTVATNAILQRKGARTALITTAGFRDVLELARLRYSKLYDVNFVKAKPLVPRRLRFVVDERMGPRGEVKKPLDDENASAVIERVRAADVEALAICLLHSYANPDHERRLAEIAREILPPHVFVTCSVDVLPEIREYERTSTTAINAYLGPVVAHYIASLCAKLQGIGIGAPLQVMQSNGGILYADAVLRKPAAIVESGPAAGVIGAARIAPLSGYPNIISLDMGGTTAKASMVEDGAVVKTSDYEVGAGINLSSKLAMGGGHALKLPVIDVSEIGAGGGSIVAVDRHGRLQVGPESAGAVPGPVCYDVGGERATLTDALVALGYLNPDYLVGGEMRLNAEKARQALLEQVARPLGRGLPEAAHGVQVVAGATMMRAVKAVSTYRGRDPRDFDLFAFGGSGPVLATEVARQLGMRRVIVPPSAGLFSAIGLLLSNIEHEFARAFFRRSTEVGATELEEIYEALEARARAALASDGFETAQMTIVRQADLRYSGQAYELTVAVGRNGAGEVDVADIVEAFGAEHLRTYGHRAEDEPVDLVSVRVIGEAEPIGPRALDPRAAVRGHREPGDRAGERMVYFGPGHGSVGTPVVGRAELPPAPSTGPLIVEEYDATSVIPPDWRASLDPGGNIVIETG